MAEENKLKLKKTLADKKAKYLTLVDQSKRLDPTTTPIFEEMLDDIVELDTICKERNKY